MREFLVRDSSHGFSWGPMQVVRLRSDSSKGVYLVVAGPDQADTAFISYLEINVSPSGELTAWSVTKNSRKQIYGKKR